MVRWYDKKDVEAIRSEAGKCNQTTLLRLAVNEFVKRHSKPKGGLDIKNIAQMIEAQSVPIEIERTKAKLRELEEKAKTIKVE